jgi:N-acetylneuraminate synthase
MKKIEILNRVISKAHKPYTIAEISANHNGSIEKALRLVELAAEAGVDAVKLQTYTADTMTIKSGREEFLIKHGLWDGYSLYDLYSEAHTPWEWHEQILELAREKGLHCFSSPFDETAVDFLEGLNVPAFKLASFEMTDIPLVRKIASTGKPMIISTGMANFEEIRETVDTVREYHNDFVLLHCISAYPAPHVDQNLLTIPLIEKEFDCLVGLSDHSLSNSSSITAIALGATVIEKHFIESRADHGPDSAFSLEPSELRELEIGTREAWQSLGEGSFRLKESETGNRKFRRSVYFIRDLKKGQVIQDSDIRRIRPGYGLAPKYFDEIVGKVTVEDIECGTPVSWDLIS